MNPDNNFMNSNPEVPTTDLMQQLNPQTSITTEHTQIPQQPQVTDVKEFAKQKGHMSYDSWVSQGRNPDLYIDEETWVKNYTWLNQINQLKKQSQEQKQALDYLVEHNKKVEQLGFQRGVEAAKQRQLEAISNGDVDEITKATEELVKMQAQVAAQPQVSSGEIDVTGQPPEVQAFVKRNSTWFNNKTSTNSAATAYAITRENELSHLQPNLSTEERFKMVENEVKIKFFSNPAMNASPVVSGSTPPPTAKAENDLSDLSPEDQAMVRILMKTTRNFDLKQYKEHRRRIQGDSFDYKNTPPLR